MVRTSAQFKGGQGYKVSFRQARKHSKTVSNEQTKLLKIHKNTCIQLNKTIHYYIYYKSPRIPTISYLFIYR